MDQGRNRQGFSEFLAAFAKKLEEFLGASRGLQGPRGCRGGSGPLEGFQEPACLSRVWSSPGPDFVVPTWPPCLKALTCRPSSKPDFGGFPASPFASTPLPADLLQLGARTPQGGGGPWKEAENLGVSG